MMQIIGGVEIDFDGALSGDYNIETSTLIGEYTNGYRSDDCNYKRELLYRGKEGDFFIVVDGNHDVDLIWDDYYRDDMRFYGRVVLLLDDAALFWCEQHDIDADVIAQHFEVKEA